VGAHVSPGDLVALRAVQCEIPLNYALYLRLEKFGLIVRAHNNQGWINSARGQLLNSSIFF
jgi:hypothetical protein